ncbi:hypothetical protein [Neoroseomonas oryzicola]|uniref:Uncharacterized protein n=1 Tax=Neoroseomonas oryzicola TaxID=535904 RepID=A0A9X9WIZ4_9PROT|nr:hypothetical protein [Neoroseomonas oryzicola]MBR0660304.1 hypothetical protein [Neoroseomonas oryzicola]NKE18009.1 hypothetical protein [Neoroseomonas oryzicola]
MMRILALLLVLAAAPAMAQPYADWRMAAPLLPLDAPSRAMRQAVTIGGEAWGPWQRLCREQTLRPGRPPQRDCLMVTEARREGDGVRLTLRHEPTGLLITAQRGVDGRIGAFEAVRADGTAPPDDARRAALLAAWREQFATLSLERRRIGPNDQFPLPVEGSPRGGICRPDGTATIGGRPVLVARCAVELAGRLRGGESDARVAIFARVAIDVATGVVSAQGYATRIETFAANGRSNGVVITPSRVVLE